jgi:hypothetical protein
MVGRAAAWRLLRIFRRRAMVIVRRFIVVLGTGGVQRRIESQDRTRLGRGRARGVGASRMTGRHLQRRPDTRSHEEDQRDDQRSEPNATGSRLRDSGTCLLHDVLLTCAPRLRSSSVQKVAGPPKGNGGPAWWAQGYRAGGPEVNARRTIRAAPGSGMLFRDLA